MRRKSTRTKIGKNILRKNLDNVSNIVYTPNEVEGYQIMGTIKTKRKLSHEEQLPKEVIRHFRNKGYDLSGRQLRHWDKFGLLHPFKDESGYRRFTSLDIDQITLILGLKGLGISLPRIKKILAWILPNDDLIGIMKKNPLSLIAKYKDVQGKEEWYPKREIRDEIEEIKESIKKSKETIKRFEEVFGGASTNLYKAILRYRTQIKKK